MFVWIGAAVFVASLAYFLFSYLVTFDASEASGTEWGSITWNVGLFTLFALHHSIFARERVRAWIARHVPPMLERSVYVWVASVLFIAVCALWSPVPGVVWEAHGGVLWTLRLLQVAGIWLSLRSAALLDVRQLAGIRAVNSSHVEFRTRGPYGWVRHPIYSGWFLLVCAASLMTMTRFVFAAVSCAYLLVAIPFEERSMRTASRDGYEQYARQVPWRLLPGVY